MTDGDGASLSSFSSSACDAKQSHRPVLDRGRVVADRVVVFLKRRTTPPRSTKIKRAPRRSYIPEAPIVRIVTSEKLNIGESSAALDILLANRSASLPSADHADLPAPADFDAADNRAAKQTDLTRAFSKWRTDLRDTTALRVADAILLSEQPLNAVDQANHWPRGTALAHLTAALRHFAFLRGNAPRGAAAGWKYR